MPYRAEVLIIFNPLMKFNACGKWQYLKYVHNALDYSTNVFP